MQQIGWTEIFEYEHACSQLSVRPLVSLWCLDKAVNNDVASLYYIIEDLPEGEGVHAPLFPIKTYSCCLFPQQQTKVFPEIYFSSVPMFPEIVLLVPLIPQNISHCSPEFLPYFIFACPLFKESASLR